MNCNLCRRELDQQDDPFSGNYSGDCLLCVSERLNDPYGIRVINERLFKWLDEHHTLHYGVEFLYVIHEYDATLTYDGNPLFSVSGKTIREALIKLIDENTKRDREIAKERSNAKTIN